MTTNGIRAGILGLIYLTALAGCGGRAKTDHNGIEPADSEPANIWMQPPWRDLRSHDMATRHRAARKVVRMGRDALEPLLVEGACRDEFLAQLILLRMPPKLANHIIETAADGWSFSRSTATDALSNMGPGVLPVLEKGLESGNNNIRYICAIAMGGMGREALPPLLVAFRREQKIVPFLIMGPDTRGAYMSGICGIDNPCALAALAEIVSLTEAEMPEGGFDRWAALEALGKHGPAGLPVIVYILQNEPSLRIIAINTLSDMGNKKAIRFIEPFLKDTHESVRWSAGLALAKLGKVQAALLAATAELKKNGLAGEYAPAAIRIISYAGNTDETEKLIMDGMDSKNPCVVLACVEAAGRLRLKGFEEELVEFTKPLPRAGSPRYVPGIEAGIQHEAFRSLVEIAPMKARDILKGVVRSSRAHYRDATRIIAIQLLEKINSSETVSILAETMTDRSELVRYCAACALSRRDDKKSREVLKKYVNDFNVFVAEAAKEAQQTAATAKSAK